MTSEVVALPFRIQHKIIVMRRFLNLLILVFLAIFSACENIQDSQIPDYNAKIATVNEQFEAIRASVPKLKSTLNSLNALTSESQSQDAAALTKSSSNGNINNIKEYILALEARIEALEAYVYGDQSGDWTETTYATIEMYEETIGILANMQCEIDALKGSLESAKEQILEDVTKNIEECCSSMKSWVNEQLTGYYDIAATDAMLAKLQESLTAEDESIRKEIDDLRSDLAEQLDDMKADYKSAIKSAIEENNGVLTAKLEKAIKDVNARIDSAIEDMDKRMKDIEDRLSKLEDTVEALIKRIQTIAYIPIYDDEKARVNFPNTDTSEGRLTLDFRISPKNAVTDLVKASNSGDVVSVQAIYTGSPIAVDLPVVECSANETQGIFSLTVACDNLNMEFYNGDLNARAIMYISDGNNDKTSDYIQLTPNPTHVADNQIWYTVTGKTPVDIKIGNGPKIVSNSYDYAKECYIVVFEQAINSIPPSYFAGHYELKTVSLPDSIISIEDSAFEGCNNLYKVSLGNSIMSIGSKAFKDCALTEVVLPEDLNSIGQEAFDYNEIQSFTGGPTASDGLTLVLENQIKAVALGGIRDGKYSMPAGVSAVEADVFQDCEKIVEVNIDDIQAWCNIDFSGKFSNPLHNGAQLKLKGEIVEDVIFPNQMTQVKSYTFYGCTSLKSATLHNKVTSVGLCAFDGCVNLNTLILQSTTPPSLGSGVFNRCENLKIYIPGQEDAIKSYLSCDWYDLYKHMVVWNVGDFPKTHCIEYTTSDNKPVQFSAENLHSHTYENGKGIITFTVPCTSFKGFDSGAERILTCELPESVSVIGTGAFSGCSSMTSFEIPEAVTAINASTFKGCGSLSEITIPENIEVIGASAFENCVSLAGFAFPNKVTAINNSTFAGCVKLNNVVIHKDITNIGANAFAGCTGLTSLEFESAIPPAVHPTAFDSCNTLKITIPTEEASVKAYLASGWSDAMLQKIPYLLDPANLPAGYWLEYTTTDNQPVQFKDSNIFYSYYSDGKGFALSRNQINSFGGFTAGAERILTCELPESVSVIGAGAFSGCSALTGFEFSPNIKKIQSLAFNGCVALTSVTFHGNIPPKMVADAFGTTLSHIIIPETSEMQYMGCDWDIRYKRLIQFNNYPESHIIRYKTLDARTVAVNELLDVQLLRNIYEEGEGVMILDRPVVSLPDEAFKSSSYLSEITFPSVLEYIGSRAFHSCRALKEVVLPDSVTEIGSSAFSYTALEKVTLGNAIRKIGDSAFYECSNLTLINFPDGIREIGASAFNSCKNLESIELPNSLTSIGSSAFSGCYALTSLKIPASIKVLEPGVFAYCSGLTRIDIPDGITSIGSAAFESCHKLKRVSIPSSVKAIEDSAFENCDMLKELYIDDLEAWLKIDMEPSSHPFGGSHWGDVQRNMYLKGEKLVDVVIPDTIEHIPNCAFYRVSSLKTVFVPASVKSLGWCPFSETVNVQVKFESTTPPAVNGTFDWFNGSILVPQSSVELYKVQPGWPVSSISGY